MVSSPSGVKWVKVDVRNDASLFPVFLFESGAGRKSAMHKALGVSLKGLMYSFHSDGSWVFYEVKGDFKRISEELAGKVAQERNFVSHAISETYRLGGKMLKLTQEIASADLSKKSNSQLWRYYAGYCKRCKEMRGYAWIAPALDLSGALTEELERILAVRLRPLGKRDELPAYFNILTNPKKPTLGKQQDIGLLKIATMAKSKAGMRTPKIQTLLALHTKKYEWLPCTYENAPWTFAYFESVAANMIGQGVDAGEELRKIELREREVEAQRKKALFELKLYPWEERLFAIASDILFFKANRKDMLFKSYFQMRPLIREIARRLHLTPKQVMFLLPNEVKAALESGKTSPSILNERARFCVGISIDDSTAVFVGKNAKRILERHVEKQEVKQVRELLGQCACPGYAKGAVKLVLSPKDIHKMKKGDILVSPATNPDIVQAMKLAGAIVTNTGGLTSHAAIVSRELNIPCVVGTKVATELLRDGEIVEVDASKGIVRRLKGGA